MRSEVEKKIRKEIGQIIGRCRCIDDAPMQRDLSYLIMVLRQQQFEIQKLRKEMKSCPTKTEN